MERKLLENVCKELEGVKWIVAAVINPDGTIKVVPDQHFSYEGVEEVLETFLVKDYKKVWTEDGEDYKYVKFTYYKIANLEFIVSDSNVYNTTVYNLELSLRE